MVNKPSQNPSQIDRVQQAQTGGGWFPSDTPGPRTPKLPSNAVQQSLPTLDLLITVRLLQQAVTQKTVELEPEARQTLLALLKPLATQQTWHSAKAAQLQQDLLDALTPAQVAVLERQRAALERYAQTMLSRARLPTQDGPVNLLLARYGLMVLGGLSAVKAVLAAPQTNPYAVKGPNADVLMRLLVKLQ